MIDTLSMVLLHAVVQIEPKHLLQGIYTLSKKSLTILVVDLVFIFRAHGLRLFLLLYGFRLRGLHECGLIH